MKLCYLINGSPSAALNPQDRGLAYGHGLFETLRIFEGRLPLWPYHWKRLTLGARALGIDINQDTLEKEVEQALVLASTDGILKLIVTAGVGPRGYRAAGALSPNRVLQWFPLAVEQPESARLQRCDYRLSQNRALAGLKHLNRLDQVLAAEEVRDGCQGLLLDSDGNLIEALSHNLFLRLNQRWVTPSLNYAGVAGVMRSVLLDEVFAALDIEIAEAVLSVDELYRADEVFICNSLQGVIPIIEEVVAGKIWPPGSDTQQIQQKLQELYPCFTA